MRRKRRAIAAEELTERQIAAIRKAKVPEQFSYLDAELGDWNPEPSNENKTKPVIPG